MFVYSLYMFTFCMIYSIYSMCFSQFKYAWSIGIHTFPSCYLYNYIISLCTAAKKKAVDNICYMLIIRVLSSLSPSRFPHYHLFHRPHPLATGTPVAGTAVPNGPGAAFQPPGNWEEEVLGAWIHVAWLWPYCQYVNLGHRYFAMAAYWERLLGCPITASVVIDSELIL